MVIKGVKPQMLISEKKTFEPKKEEKKRETSEERNFRKYLGDLMVVDAPKN